jgi:hypothetical protein
VGDWVRWIGKFWILLVWLSNAGGGGGLWGVFSELKNHSRTLDVPNHPKNQNIRSAKAFAFSNYHVSNFRDIQISSKQIIYRSNMLQYKARAMASISNRPRAWLLVIRLSCSSKELEQSVVLMKEQEGYHKSRGRHAINHERRKQCHLIASCTHTQTNKQADIQRFAEPVRMLENHARVSLIVQFMWLDACHMTFVWSRYVHCEPYRVP